MSLKTTNRELINEVPWGVYVWQCEDGEFLGDSDGNFLMTTVTTEDNPQAIRAITEAARHYGFAEGKPVYWSGKRPISDEEYERQLDRQRAGLVPDPLDIGAIKDEERALRAHNG